MLCFHKVDLLLFNFSSNLPICLVLIIGIFFKIVAAKWRLVPGVDHGKPTEIEILFTVPAHSRIAVTFHHEKAFLLWTEHPPDAHRGHDIPSARYLELIFIFIVTSPYTIDF
jgi:hypothetical protein